MTKDQNTARELNIEQRLSLVSGYIALFGLLMWNSEWVAGSWLIGYPLLTILVVPFVYVLSVYPFWFLGKVLKFLWSPGSIEEQWREGLYSFFVRLAILSRSSGILGMGIGVLGTLMSLGQPKFIQFLSFSIGCGIVTICIDQYFFRPLAMRVLASGHPFCLQKLTIANGRYGIFVGGTVILLGFVGLVLTMGHPLLPWYAWTLVWVISCFVGVTLISGYSLADISIISILLLRDSRGSKSAVAVKVMTQVGRGMSMIGGLGAVICLIYSMTHFKDWTNLLYEAQVAFGFWAFSMLFKFFSFCCESFYLKCSNSEDSKSNHEEPISKIA